MTKRSNASGDHVVIGGVRLNRVIPTRRTVLGASFGLPGVYEVELISEYDPAAGRYTARRVAVEARDGGEVTGEVMRALRLGEILRDSLRGYNGVPDEHPADLVELGRAGPTDETLRAVGRVYEIGHALGDPPTQRVAEAFGVPRGTAARWVTRARDRGYLTVTDPRTPGSGDRRRRVDG